MDNILPLMGKESEKKFMRVDLFEEQSLIDTINDLSDKQLVITPKKLINLVVKYLYAYRHPGSINQKIALRDIEYIMDQAHRYFRLSREKPGQNTTLNEGDDIKEFEFFQKHGYSISMLGDIAATTAIVQEIIKTPIESRNFNNDYLGFDLGSGSGILTVAGTIGAIRTGFDTILSIGIDSSKNSIERSRIVLNSLFPNKVLLIDADTTDDKSMKKFQDPHNRKKIVRVINETITTSGIAMGSGPDPFHQNILAIYDALEDMITPDSVFFPSKISMFMELGPNRTNIEGNSENQFGSKKLKEFEKVIFNTPGVTLPENWSIFNQVFPLGIEVDGNITPMHQVGADLYTHGWLQKLPYWRHRWSNKSIES